MTIKQLLKEQAKLTQLSQAKVQVVFNKNKDLFKTILQRDSQKKVKEKLRIALRIDIENAIKLGEEYFNG